LKAGPTTTLNKAPDAVLWGGSGLVEDTVNVSGAVRGSCITPGPNCSRVILTIG
jgi:hypothetical protein